MEHISGLRDMQNTPAAILPLSADVIAQIKSSTTVTSLNGVVLGLFENSLDAQATKIDVSVDYRRGGCTVEDNGLGILPSEFREDGGLGRMYHTSKQKDSTQHEVHGGSGTFLASVSALSLVTITSRHYKHYSHNTLSMHRTKPISRLLPAPPQQEIRNSVGHGTRVSVRDLFGNMPVRVKQRAINVEETSEMERQWQALKTGIVGLLLPWSHRVTVKVSDAENQARNFSINTGANFALNTLSERNLNSLNGRPSKFDHKTITSILSQSGLVSIDSKDSWVPVSASTLSITIKGLISLEPAPSKATQFVSIGITPCLDENRHNELYDAINRVFGQSSFGHTDDASEPDEVELKRRQHDRRFKKDGLTNKQVRGGRKGVDRWPKFYFHIELSPEESVRPVSKLSEMHLRSIVNILESLTTHWLDANGFCPKNKHRKQKSGAHEASHMSSSSSTALCGTLSPTSDSQIPSASHSKSSRSLTPTASQAGITGETKQSSKRANLGPDSSVAVSKMPFTDRSRIKSSRPHVYDSIWESKMPHARRPIAEAREGDEANEVLGTRSSTIRVEKVLAGQFGTGQGDSSESTKAPVQNAEMSTQPDGAEEDAVIDWIDPKTNEKHRINARTGVVMPDVPRRMVSGDTITDRRAAAADSRTSSFGNPLVLERRKESTSIASSSASPWLSTFLQTWKNPTFVNPAEQAISTAGLRESGLETCSSSSLEKCCVATDSFSRTGRTDSSRLSKTALLHAQVISQVDQKFILMRMPSISKSSPELLDHNRHLLVMMDQHAASERCILETLLNELCTPDQGAQSVKSNVGHSSPVSAVQVDQPLHFQIPHQEQAMFKVHAGHFANWGILYDLRTNDPGSARVSILTLPPGISERCKAEPKLIMELLRGEIYALAEMSSSSGRTRATTPCTADEKHQWLRKLGSCPQGLLHLLNSRACRSAIMFNDKLEIEECQSLVDRLAKCVFPFMCAHGRNSMVPLVYLDGEESNDEHLDGSGSKENHDDGFADAYKNWRKKVQA